ncbi:hypothetical protein [Marinitenerispora sediminis]|uniref:hypothetical protein n=1 Tax=Marinitenerispora sediminis TaxID=1931232 RepID=UPI001314B236|nr:hypothetical protein [Marinitenerispora sediminis]
MLLYELVQLQKTADEKRDSQRQRLDARSLRAQLRERRRAEQAVIEMRFARLC